MIENEQLTQKYIKLLQKAIPNIKSSIYTAIFSKKKIKETTDAIVFGFYIGFFSSCLDIVVDKNDIEKLLEIYSIQAKGTDSLDMLLEQVSVEYSKYFSLFHDRNEKEKENENGNDKGNEKKSNTIINNQSANILKENKLIIENPSVIDINENLEYSGDNNNLVEGNNISNVNDLNFEYEGDELSKKKCLICLEEFNLEDELNYWLDCSCIIHNTCFDQYIASCINDNSLPIKCPECNKEINSSFVYESLIQGNQSLIPKYEKFTLNYYAMHNGNDVNCCPTAGCSYIFFYEEGDARFVCPTCEKDYCLPCKTDWHEGISCEENKKLTNTNYLDEKFNAFVKGAQYKQCPFCSAWVERSGGCDYMACRCGKAFCYRCGEKYSNQHNCYLNTNFPFAARNPQKRRRRK